MMKIDVNFDNKDGIKSLLDNICTYDSRFKSSDIAKNVNLKTYEKMTVNNLEICNFKLLSNIIKVYKLVK